MRQPTSGNYRIDVDVIQRWILVCAVVPVLMALAGIAFYKQISNSDPHATLVRNITWTVLLGSPLVCVGLQWDALRRFAPRLSLWMWAVASVVAFGVWLYWPSWMHRTEAGFSVALMHWRVSDAVSFDVFSGVVVTFASVVGLAASLALVTALLQIALLKFATRLPWKIIVTAVIAGALAQAIIAHLPELLGIFRRDSLNGIAWGHRLVELALRAGAGASFGIASSIAVFSMLRPTEVRETRKMSSILTGATLAVVCIPIAIAIIGRDGGRSAGLGVLKAFTPAPAQDISSGEPILRYSHAIEPRSGKYPVVHYSPNSRYLIFLDRERRLMLVEGATGRQLAQLGEALPLHDRFAVAWSPDSTAVVLRMKGETDPVPGRVYKRNRAVFRKYSIPAGELQREHLTTLDECYESSAYTSLIYAPDGHSVWTHCDTRSPPQPDSTMALELDAGSLRPARRKLYGTVSATNEVRTLGIHNGAVVYLLRRRHGEGEGEQVLLGHLSSDEQAIAIEALTDPLQTSGLLSQGEVIDSGGIRVDYCGTPEVNPAPVQQSICRTLEVDIESGQVRRVVDDFDRRLEPDRQVLSSLDGLRVESRRSPASKLSELRVIDEGTGQVRQRIEMREQRPLAFSPDRRWLVMHSPGTKELRVYSVVR